MRISSFSLPESGRAPGVLTVRAALIWTVLAAALIGPIGAAAQSPLLAWRDPVYIAAGFAGCIALALLLLQPLLAKGGLPGLAPVTARRVHRWTGGVLVLSVVAHVGGLWITSPPDVVDALLFRSPTPFSIWGVIAMWAVFATALLAAMRRRLRPRRWRAGHLGLGMSIALGSTLHVVQIEGTMEPWSKAALCALALAAMLVAVIKPRGRFGRGS